jgi:hypothetical protein
MEKMGKSLLPVALKTVFDLRGTREIDDLLAIHAGQLRKRRDECQTVS